MGRLPMAVEVLDAALKDAAIPIHGVSIKDPRDRSTWVVDYKDEATSQQRNAGATVVASLDLNDPAQFAAVATKRAVEACADPRLQAFAKALYACIKDPAMTFEDLQALIVVEYQVVR